jgi:SAM-dependent methyltransferase
MRKQAKALAGSGLMQSEAEWSARGNALSGSLANLLREAIRANASRGLDIGCQRGGLIDSVSAATGLEWVGIDPILTTEERTPGGSEIGPGRADQIPYASESFDCAILANVFEHIPPGARQDSFDEMYRVLRPGGVIAGQIPNPYFAIESHSRLPFMGLLPIRAQKRYWRLSRVPWDHDFYVVTLRHLRRHALAAGLVVEVARPFNYPPEAIPSRVRWLATAAAPLMQVYPWAWQFVLRRP